MEICLHYFCRICRVTKAENTQYALEQFILIIPRCGHDVRVARGFLAGVALHCRRGELSLILGAL